MRLAWDVLRREAASGLDGEPVEQLLERCDVALDADSVELAVSTTRW